MKQIDSDTSAAFSAPKSADAISSANSTAVPAPCEVMSDPSRTVEADASRVGSSAATDGWDAHLRPAITVSYTHLTLPTTY